MNVGDPIRFTPYAWQDSEQQEDGKRGKKAGAVLSGRVIYIHPKGRFLVAEAEVGMGRTIRETISLPLK